MSRFQLLPHGARFEFEGERYIKVGPLSAAHEASGRQRMIPRSAAIRSLDGSAKAPPVPPRPLIEPERFAAALERFEARWRAAVQDGQVAVEVLAEAQAALVRELG